MVSRGTGKRATGYLVNVGKLTRRGDSWKLRVRRGLNNPAFYNVALELGLRKAELCGLKCEDITLDECKVTVARQLVKPGSCPVFGDPKSDSGKTDAVPSGSTPPAAQIWPAGQVSTLTRGPAACSNPLFGTNHMNCSEYQALTTEEPDDGRILVTSGSWVGSTRSSNWFGIRGSQVQILPPRPNNSFTISSLKF